MAARPGLIVGLVAATTGPVAAAPPPADPEGTVVQELVVTSHLGGPAWWRVSNGASTVFILGAPEAMPKGLKWDQTLLNRRLDGANELIGPPTVSVSLGDTFALLNARKRFRSHGPMENGLAPDLRTRFLTDRATLTHDARAYSGWTPLVASLLMISDFRRTARLEERQPASTVVRLARDKGLKVVASGTYRFVPLVRAVEVGLETSGPACLADALDEIEAGAGRVDRAAAGWARGDVATALSAQRGYEKCLASLPAGADLPSKAMADTTAAITAALAKPGHSVAVVNLRPLVAQGGVLQQLQARGFKVATPNQ